jgi:hypothetical protein
MKRFATTIIAGVTVAGLLLTGCATRGSHTGLGDTDGSSYSASPPPPKYSTPDYPPAEEFQAP